MCAYYDVRARISLTWWGWRAASADTVRDVMVHPHAHAYAHARRMSRQRWCCTLAEWASPLKLTSDLAPGVFNDTCLHERQHCARARAPLRRRRDSCWIPLSPLPPTHVRRRVAVRARYSLGPAVRLFSNNYLSKYNARSECERVGRRATYAVVAGAPRSWMECMRARACVSVCIHVCWII